MIRRHTTSALCMHWFNAVCWLLLLATGFALLRNPAMQPVGAWWPRLWEGVFGATGLFWLHLCLGLLWCAVYAVYIMGQWRGDVLPFLREAFCLSPVRDAAWCGRKALLLTVGPERMRRWGLNPELPPQGFYNAGQKLVAVVAVLASLGLAVTGLFLTALALRLADPASLALAAQWALLAHFVCAGTVAVLLPVHIYMAAFAPGEEPSLRSMITGYVPEAFVRHHNPLWHAALARQGLVPASAEDAPRETSTSQPT